MCECLFTCFLLYGCLKWLGMACSCCCPDYQALQNPKAAVTMGQLRKGRADGKLKLLEIAEQRKRRLQGNQDAEGQLVKRLKGAAAKGALKATGGGHGGGAKGAGRGGRSAWGHY